MDSISAREALTIWASWVAGGSQNRWRPDGLETRHGDADSSDYAASVALRVERFFGNRRIYRAMAYRVIWECRDPDDMDEWREFVWAFKRWLAEHPIGRPLEWE